MDGRAQSEIDNDLLMDVSALVSDQGVTDISLEALMHLCDLAKGTPQGR